MDYQSLHHYSDFETNSESAYTELSLADLKVAQLNNNSRVHNGPKRIKGSRPLRRFKNDACINSLCMLLEIDLEEELHRPWPDTISIPTYLSKLFDDPLLRQAWEAFINLPEHEQRIKLNGFKNMEQIKTVKKTAFKPASERSTALEDIHDVSVDSSFTLASASNSVASSFDMCEDLSFANGRKPKKTVEKGPFGLTLAECQKVYQEPVTSYNRFSNRRRNRKQGKGQRAITALDLYLLDRAEQELRAMFKTRDLENCKNCWVPTDSLLESPEKQTKKNLWLDNYQRRLLHMLASYLGLHSESVWNDDLMDKLISIKCSWSSKEVPMPLDMFIVGMGQQNLLHPGLDFSQH